MDTRAVTTLQWLDSLRDDVASHSGAAYAEVEILRALVQESAPSEPARNVLQQAYRSDVERGLPQYGNSRSEARALAHVVMFATDFGRAPLDLADAYGARLDDLIAMYVDDTDTLGELLIACRCLKHSGEVSDDARVAFDAAWEHEPRTLDNYHVVLVGALLYAITD